MSKARATKVGLDSCPFCGGCQQLDVERIGENEGTYVRVVCRCCGAEGPRAFAGLLFRDAKPKHDREAKKLWNQRARTP